MTDALANMAQIKAAVDAYGAAARPLRDPANAARKDQNLYRLILALEAMQAVAKDAEAAARAALVEEMEENGALQIECEWHKVSLADVPRSVIITGPVPDEFMSTPEPKPDKPSIAKALKNGPLTFAKFNNGGPKALRFTSKK